LGGFTFLRNQKNVLKQNKMTKNQKLLLGVAVVGVGGFLLWKSTQKKSFANVVSKNPCQMGFSPVEIWTNAPNYPQSFQTYCINQKKGYSYLLY